MKLHSVFYVQYSQHKFKNFSWKSKLVRWQKSIYASATKVTFLAEKYTSQLETKWLSLVSKKELHWTKLFSLDLLIK